MPPLRTAGTRERSPTHLSGEEEEEEEVEEKVRMREGCVDVYGGD